MKALFNQARTTKAASLVEAQLRELLSRNAASADRNLPACERLLATLIAFNEVQADIAQLLRDIPLKSAIDLDDNEAA